MAVQELGINLCPFQVDALACVCCWLSSSSLGVTCFPDGSHTYCKVLLPCCFRFKCARLCPSCLLHLPALVVSLSCVSLVAATFLPACIFSLVALVHICPSLVSTANLSSLRFLHVVAFLSPWLLLSCASLGACASLHSLMVFLFLFPLVVSAGHFSLVALACTMTVPLLLASY
jgi:hypothetical protein